ncbi:hypothetical protein SAMD00019534_082360 [Acytostelium subglobosum LB1]|uniref:hypothetical protein n=1 Tax=Acytostelium subglobosum LB1 TaxID=1410327 RepID=UPI0006448C6F|nr:hypothetical protein SAMD00019534_082360 [Acytostelium subglobosum LB1]GAM25061.1 hypothetical protein SAMD00019534_082360 [Acytostelium subglobosum LB1]|eukprot:XP_012752150.1 hypothetical protein SAMD00019534_082360 [Acytostelium subglobosum LB1]
MNVAGELTAQQTFTVNPYVYVDSVSPLMFPFTGGKLTITGSFLGNSTYTSSVTLGNGEDNRDCGSHIYSDDQTKLICTPASFFEDSEVSVSVYQPNYNIISSAYSINFRRFEITSHQQNERLVTLNGQYFDLYPSIMLAAGGGSTNNVSCTNITCQFTITHDMTANGTLMMVDLTPGSTASFTYEIQWIPLILSFQTIFPSDDPYYTDTLKIWTQMIETAQTVDITFNSIKGDPTAPFNVPYGNPISITLPDLVGEIVIDLANQGLATSFNYTYLAPRIDTVYPETIDEVAYVGVLGKYLAQPRVGDNPSRDSELNPKIGGIVSKEFQLSGHWNYTYVRTMLPNDTRSGLMTLTIGGQVSQKFVTIRPEIKGVTSPPTAGGVVTITGYYLAPMSYNNTSVLNITVSGKECRNITMIGDLSSVPYYTLTCVAVAGSGNTTAVFNDQDIWKMQYQSPSIDSVTSTVKGKAGNVTITGSNFADVSQITVTIGSNPCSIPTVNDNFTQITCQFSSDVEPPSSLLWRQLFASTPTTKDVSLPVTVTVNGVSTTQSKFIYSVNKDVCDSPCGEHGTCVNGECQCQSGFTGITCSMAMDTNDAVDVPVPLNNSTDMVLGSKAKSVQFNISIAGINERTSTGDLAKSINMTNISWNMISSTNDDKGNVHRIYNTSLEGAPGFELIAEMTVFTDNQQYDFEGDQFQVTKSSIKYKITLNKWPFAALTNYLEVQFQSVAGPQPTCDGAEVNAKVGSTTTNKKDSLRLMEIQQGTGLLRAFYSDRLLVDGRVSYSQVSYSQPDNSSTLIVITSLSIPQFNQSAVIDPNYASLLVVNEELPTCQQTSSSRKWVIPVIVVCSIIGVALLVITGVLIAKRNRLRLLMAGVKLRQMSRRSSNKY